MTKRAVDMGHMTDTDTADSQRAEFDGGIAIERHRPAAILCGIEPPRLSENPAHTFARAENLVAALEMDRDWLLLTTPDRNAGNGDRDRAPQEVVGVDLVTLRER
jgi:hypothetical protein